MLPLLHFNTYEHSIKRYRYILSHQKGLMLNEQEHFKDKIKELPVSFIP